jgi:hypothetical protein
VVFSGLTEAGSQSMACSSCWLVNRLLFPVKALSLVQVLYAGLSACQALSEKINHTRFILPG